MSIDREKIYSTIAELNATASSILEEKVKLEALLEEEDRKAAMEKAPALLRAIPWMVIAFGDPSQKFIDTVRVHGFNVLVAIDDDSAEHRMAVRELIEAMGIDEDRSAKIKNGTLTMYKGGVFLRFTDCESMLSFIEILELDVELSEAVKTLKETSEHYLHVANRMQNAEHFSSRKPK